ncbi:MAG: gliding motility-associated C-terminal domain-containing protein [Bacteroidota bacterium]
MTKRKYSLFFGLFLAVCWVQASQAQSPAQPSLGIALSEYCVSNIGLTGSPQSDSPGNRSDWVELHSTFTSSVNMGAYYLSNDRNNLYKWKFPPNFVIGPNAYKIIWLSGKNTTYVNGTEVHTNFQVDQCKGQYLILSVGGAVRDSVLVQRTKEGHSRGRGNDYNTIGYQAWRVYPIPTFNFANNAALSFIDYAPQPKMKYVAQPLTTYTGTSVGGFFPVDPAPTVNLYLENGVPYDTSNTCFRIYYTLDNGFYPKPGVPTTTKLMDTSVIVNNPCTIIRAISVPITSGNPAAPTGCELDYLPSFCETNTYFTDDNYQTFSPDFGVVSIAMDEADTSWFNSSGSSRPLVHVEYYDKKQQVAEGYTQLNRPVQEAWITKQKGFYMTIDDRRGFGCNFEGDIFNVDSLGKTPRTVFPTLHLKAGDYDSHSVPAYTGNPTSGGTGIMDVFLQSLAARNNLHVSPLHIKPVITFLNGKYQGVYDLREVYDKYYENYYNQQSKDSLDLLFYHGGDGSVTYAEGLPSSFSTGANTFANAVYSLGISPQINLPNGYNTLWSRLDKASFMDYMILNSYAMNGNFWKYDYDIAYAKGGQANKPGNKWHYYLWNTPAIFNFTALTLPGGQIYNDVFISPCFVHSNNSYYLTNITPAAGNGHGAILRNLMGTPNNIGSKRYEFQQEYKTRYMDLLNGPLRCDYILKHYDYVKNLFLKEMRYHEDAALAIPLPGPFVTQPDLFDSNTVKIRRGIEKRCRIMSSAFGVRFAGCYGMQGPWDLTVDVQPPGAGKVRLNTLVLDNYIWTGTYYGITMTFKAIPADETYSFHHWEFKNHLPLNDTPLSMDSLQISFNQPDEVVAVFTDKKNDVTMPTGFTPNGDGINDLFQPLGSAIYSKEFDMSVWNRWGQEVYRSTDPTSGWDGSFKGQPAQTGVYAYVISYKNFYNESKILKGNLTLLR